MIVINMESLDHTLVENDNNNNNNKRKYESNTIDERYDNKKQKVDNLKSIEPNVEDFMQHWYPLDDNNIHERVKKLILNNNFCEKQRSAAWHYMRSQQFNASDAGSSIPSAFPWTNKYKTRLMLFKDKTGLSAKWTGNEATAHGTFFENYALLNHVNPFNGTYKNHVLTSFGTMKNPKHPWLGASPDGICAYAPILLEIKCPFYSGGFPILSKTCPKYYYPQVQVLLEVLDLEYCHFIQFVPPIASYDSKFINGKCIKENIYEKDVLKIINNGTDENAYKRSMCCKVIKIARDQQWFDFYSKYMKDFQDKIIKFYNDNNVPLGYDNGIRIKIESFNKCVKVNELLNISEDIPYDEMKKYIDEYVEKNNLAQKSYDIRDVKNILKGLDQYNDNDDDLGFDKNDTENAYMPKDFPDEMNKVIRYTYKSYDSWVDENLFRVPFSFDKNNINILDLHSKIENIHNIDYDNVDVCTDNINEGEYEDKMDAIAQSPFCFGTYRMPILENSSKYLDIRDLNIMNSPFSFNA